jgi:hypothetical protein
MDEDFTFVHAWAYNPEDIPGALWIAAAAQKLHGYEFHSFQLLQAQGELFAHIYIAFQKVKDSIPSVQEG